MRLNDKKRALRQRGIAEYYTLGIVHISICLRNTNSIREY